MEAVWSHFCPAILWSFLQCGMELHLSSTVLFLTIWPVEKMGRSPSSRIEMCRVDVANTLHKLWLTSAPDCFPRHHWKTTMFDSWLQLVQRKLLTGKSPVPYTSTLRKLSKLGLIWKKMTVCQNSKGLVAISSAHFFLLWKLAGLRRGFLRAALP